MYIYHGNKKQENSRKLTSKEATIGTHTHTHKKKRRVEEKKNGSGIKAETLC